LRNRSQGYYRDARVKRIVTDVLRCRHAGETEIAMPAKRLASSSEVTDKTLEEMRALFGANFRQARLKAKLTQVAVQELTGIQQHYISEVENGLHNPTLDTMTILAGAIGTNPRALLRPLPKRR
jgi:DNA-binding XRE family transcriptional regulator